MLIIALIAMGGLGILFAASLAIASKKLKVKEDPRVEKVLNALPQTDCGACGYPGCRPQAEKMASGDDPPNACMTGGQEVADSVAAALGVEAHESVRMVAVMLCNGGE
ncbi:MAG: RnfABCDGE type electron transport complex subunit B, partial [Thermodesulfobacteriota bacterium]